MKAFCFVVLGFILAMVLVDAMPAGGGIRSFFGKKKEAPSSSHGSNKTPSYVLEPRPNIANTHSPNAEIVPATHENKQRHINHVERIRQSAAVSERENFIRDPEAGIANQRMLHYAKHNKEQISMASPSRHFAISRSESGRNDVYHAISHK